MEKRKLGQIEVFAIGMGCMGLSHGYGVIPEHEYSVEAIRKAFANGCTFFDTAEVYGHQQQYPGHNEELVGEALEPVRGQVVIATKITITNEELEQEGDVEAIIRRHLAASLKRLRTRYVDLYYWHRVNRHVPVEKVAAVMKKLIDEGLIRGWGLSQVEVDTIERAHRVCPLSAVQNLYNMLERDCEKRVIPYCLAHGIGLVPFSPVASGYLSGKVQSESQFETVDDVRSWVPQMRQENLDGNRPVLALIEALAAKKDATSAQVSMAWMLKKAPHIVPIPGSKNQERILENLGAADVALTDEEFEALDAALDTLEVHGHRGIVQFME